MIIISHRGNLNGPNKETENTIDAINHALNEKFDVEVDVWYKNKNFYLGHDEPLYKIDRIFLSHPYIWCHLKNKEALVQLYNNHKGIHYFWHNTDPYTITSEKYVWSYINAPLIKNCISVLPELGVTGKLKYCRGICTDYPIKYRKKYRNDE